MKILYEDLVWSAEINWSRPIQYNNVKNFEYEMDEIAYFYKITGKFSHYKHKLFYIGKTYTQTVKIRLNQKDHLKRYEDIKINYPRFKLFVSFGEVTLSDGKRTRNRIDEIESLLIYAHDLVTMQNKSKIWSLSVNEQYRIINRGYFAPMHKEIAYGMFYK